MNPPRSRDRAQVRYANANTTSVAEPVEVAAWQARGRRSRPSNATLVAQLAAEAIVPAARSVPEGPQEPVPTTALKDATITGVRWTMLSRVVLKTVALGSTVVLAHLVTPSAFGRAAVALALLPLATILTFEGFASVLVQKPTLDECTSDGLLLSLLSGLLLSAVAFVLARPVGGAIFGSDTGALLQMASPVFLLAAVGSVPRALLWRRLDFRMIGVADVAGLVANSAVSLALAFAGLGGRALIAGALAQTFAISLVLVLAAPPPRPAFARSAQRESSASGCRRRWRGSCTRASPTSTSSSSRLGSAPSRRASTGERSSSARSTRTSSPAS